MSIVVWDGKTLAADRQSTVSGMRREAQKIFRCGNDKLVAVCGQLWLGREMLHWLECGAKPAAFPAAQRDKDESADVWVIHRSGEIEHYECSPFAIPVKPGAFAEGSGRDFAYGAMSLGADAVRAVEVACEHAVGCGMGVDILTFDTP